MKNMRLSVKLIGGFVIVALIALAIGFGGWGRSGQMCFRKVDDWF